MLAVLVQPPLDAGPNVMTLATLAKGRSCSQNSHLPPYVRLKGGRGEEQEKMVDGAQSEHSVQ